MEYSYTMEANVRCLDLSEDGLYDIWEHLENIPDDASPADWQETLNRIARQYSSSSRFALMRLVCHRATGNGLDRTEQAQPFTVHLNGKAYSFSGLSMDCAQSLSQKELELYGDALLDMASTQENHDPVQDRLLIAHALSDSETYGALARSLLREEERKSKTVQMRILRESKRPLSRMDAMRLGHILGMTPDEMNWFLLRVFDYEDGLRYNYSSDLIDAYGLITGIGWQQVERLKEEYRSRSASIPKARQDQRPRNWTSDGRDSLPSLVQKWSVSPDDEKEQFLDWLLRQAPYLDTPSASALRLYRTLAVFCYRILRGEQDIPTSSTELSGLIWDMCREENAHETAMRALLFPEGQFAEKVSDQVARVLLRENNQRTIFRPNPHMAWRTFSVRDTIVDSTRVIRPDSSMAGRPDAEKNRVAELLRGMHQVEKGDMLYLLWFVFCLFWEEHDVTPGSLGSHLQNFTDAARNLLDCALLPDFYPPHIMEQGMLLSITAAAKATDDGSRGNPSHVYTEITEKMVQQRAKRKAAQ